MWAGAAPTTGIVRPGVANRFTLYGAPGALIDRFNVFARWEGTRDYEGFFDGRSLLESQAFLNSQFTLRGGWNVGVSPSFGSYAFFLKVSHLFDAVGRASGR